MSERVYCKNCIHYLISKFGESDCVRMDIIRPELRNGYNGIIIQNGEYKWGELSDNKNGECFHYTPKNGAPPKPEQIRIRALMEGNHSHSKSLWQQFKDLIGSICPKSPSVATAVLSAVNSAIAETKEHVDIQNYAINDTGQVIDSTSGAKMPPCEKPIELPIGTKLPKPIFWSEPKALEQISTVCPWDFGNYDYENHLKECGRIIELQNKYTQHYRVNKGPRTRIY